MCLRGDRGTIGWGSGRPAVVTWVSEKLLTLRTPSDSSLGRLNRSRGGLRESLGGHPGCVWGTWQAFRGGVLEDLGLSLGSLKNSLLTDTKRQCIGVSGRRLGGDHVGSGVYLWGDRGVIG